MNQSTMDQGRRSGMAKLGLEPLQQADKEKRG